MKSRLLKLIIGNITGAFLLITFILPLQADGKDWFVRPSEGDYGISSGENYNNAWDGLKDIKWCKDTEASCEDNYTDCSNHVDCLINHDGLKGGDTLYVCGTHTDTFLEIEGSGSDGSVITIDGECNDGSGASDPGVIIGAIDLSSMDDWDPIGLNQWATADDSFSSLLDTNNAKDENYYKKIPGWAWLVKNDGTPGCNNNDYYICPTANGATTIDGDVWWETQTIGGSKVDTTGRMIMYVSSDSNPASVYSNIIIPNHYAGIYAYGQSYVDIINMTVMYIKNGGIWMRNVDNFSVSDSIVSIFGGGKGFNGGSNSGNGIMFTGNSRDSIVQSNYVSQGLDVGLDVELMKDFPEETFGITFQDNTIEYCGGGIALSAHRETNSKVHDITVTRNIFRYLGMGWAGYDLTNSHGKGIGIKEYRKNVVKNGSFEDGFLDWTQGSASVDTTQQYRNDQSIRIDMGPGELYDGTYQDISVASEASFVVEGYIKTDNILSVKIIIEDNDTAAVVAETEALTGTNGWSYVRVDFDNSPLVPDEHSGDLRLVVVSETDAGTSGSVWYDHLKFTIYSEVYNIHITDNEIDTYAWTGITMWEGQATILRNVIKNGTAEYGNDDYSKPAGIMIHGNDYENDYSAYEAVALIANNVLINNKGHGIFIINNTPTPARGNVEIYNNTFYNNGYYEEPAGTYPYQTYSSTTSRGTIFKNNIVYSVNSLSFHDAKGTLWADSTTSDYNIFFSENNPEIWKWGSIPYSDISIYSRDSGNDFPGDEIDPIPHSYLSDPLFFDVMANRFDLNALSNGIDAGDFLDLDPEADPDLDFCGQPIYEGLAQDIGAFEGECLSYFNSWGLCTDDDRDGHDAEGGLCGIADQDDLDNTVYPGAPEIPDDGKDNDQDGLIDEIITWTGSTSGDWNTAVNWDLNIVPQTSDNIIITDALYDPALTSAVTVNNLTIESGILTLDAYSLTVGM